MVGAGYNSVHAKSRPDTTEWDVYQHSPELWATLPMTLGGYFTLPEPWTTHLLLLYVDKFHNKRFSYNTKPIFLNTDD